MEWLESLLARHGVPDDAIKAIVAEAADQQGIMIPKHRFDEVNEAKKRLEAELAERDKQLSELKKLASGNDELRAEIERLQAENREKEAAYKAQIRELSVKAAIKLAVAGQAHDPDLVASLIDTSQLEIEDDGTIKGGLDDAIKELRAAKPFLFRQEDKGPQFRGVTPAESADKPSVIKNPWSKEHFNLTEQARLLRENPELARQLQAQAGG